LPHKIETQNQIQIPDQAFDNLFELFARYSWSLNDIPGGADNEINPDVLGYIFDKNINLYGAIIGRIQFLQDRALKKWLKEQKSEHANLSYFIKKRNINLYKLFLEQCYNLLNRKNIFEAVDSRFKFVVLSFEKGGKTTEFPAVCAMMFKSF